VTLTNHGPPTAPKLRVLVVDDYPDSAEAAAMLLTLRGHDCRTASTGQEALEQAGVFKPHIVILDIGLPDMSGYEVARALRERAGGASLYLAAVTGWGQPSDRARAFAAGFDCHVTKPADLDKLSLIMKLAAQYFAEHPPVS
jgi:CheY-like chemotaxis protein